MIPCNFLLPKRCKQFLTDGDPPKLRLVRQRSDFSCGAGCTRVTVDLTPCGVGDAPTRPNRFADGQWEVYGTDLNWELSVLERNADFPYRMLNIPDGRWFGEGNRLPAPICYYIYTSQRKIGLL